MVNWRCTLTSLLEQICFAFFWCFTNNVQLNCPFNWNFIAVICFEYLLLDFICTNININTFFSFRLRLFCICSIARSFSPESVVQIRAVLQWCVVALVDQFIRTLNHYRKPATCAHFKCRFFSLKC